ncbi:MAG: hypothetical protein PHP26_07950 [Syntrophomonas sp.]|uniref:hypothetical protein n=1 Tax=Syntrophomonas sp. TaxID=2053627 RepID=UPI0026117FF2|nr:hypothetical protein [Syntrophomonas sp.]MDD2509772.1 hypothetical protein [Syntrophomonas sp.]MDD3879906.1 hypothetical protein [Syntrophomonas sp.]MDD4625735.1 hypothetical protein [Syntrophomonas sp.]
MNEHKIFFSLLLLACIILHFSFWALFISHNTFYFAAIFLALAAVIFIVYILYEMHQKQKPACSKDYYFYFIDRQNYLDESLLFPFRVKQR